MDSSATTTPASRTSQWIIVGFLLTNAILLIYGLLRPDSLDFSIIFLIPPTMAVLGTFMAQGKVTKRAGVVAIAAVICGLIVVLLITELTG